MPDDLIKIINSPLTVIILIVISFYFIYKVLTKK